ncbi:hypothetical protein M758_11G021600 [Ceratodon purpureus]|nr:hypothetical protein M758_11G021600 [Ceratodon purpureus]
MEIIRRMFINDCPRFSILNPLRATLQPAPREAIREAQFVADDARAADAKDKSGAQVKQHRSHAGRATEPNKYSVQTARGYRF